MHGDKELLEKLGRNDPCPCGSGKRLKKCCLRLGCTTAHSATTTNDNCKTSQVSETWLVWR